MTGEPPSPIAPFSIARSVEVPRDRVARWVINFVDRHGATTWSPEGARLAGRAADGARVIIDTELGEPPWGEDPVRSLVDHLMIDRRCAVLLIRRGGHAIGVFEGTKPLASKVGRRYVQGTTKAGGWSQQRYARRRANQTRDAVGDCADDAAGVLAGAGRLDGLWCGGDATLCDAVLTDKRLAGVAAVRRDATVRAVPDPRQDVLFGFIHRCLGVTVGLDAVATGDRG